MGQWLVAAMLSLGLSAEAHKIEIMMTVPRTVSTAFERSMMARGDHKVFHEPWNSEYVYRKQLGSTPAAEIADAGSYSGIRDLLYKYAEQKDVYVKDMIWAIQEDLLNDEALLSDPNVVLTLLIRDPALSIDSFFPKIYENASVEEAVKITEWVFRYDALLALAKKYREIRGEWPMIVEAEELCVDPDTVMQNYCKNAGIAYLPESLRWDQKEAAEWEHTKSWHTDAAESTGFFASKRLARVRFSTLPEECRPQLEAIYQKQKPYYEELRKIKDAALLENHFTLFYQKLAEVKVHPNAIYEDGEIKRSFCGIDDKYYNMVMGVPEEAQWDQTIQEQRAFFKEQGIPFVWYVNEAASPKFKEKLAEHGFKDGGVFRGVIGTLDPSILSPNIPADCTLERVQDQHTMNEWMEVVSASFGMDEIKDVCKEALFKTKMVHWLARKEGKAVSALSTIIEGDTVSFWHGATLPEMRKQGLSSALRRFALQDAISQGCHKGASYLMSAGLAYGICQKLGFETKWRFNVFLSE